MLLQLWLHLKEMFFLAQTITGVYIKKVQKQVNKNTVNDNLSFTYWLHDQSAVIPEACKKSATVTEVVCWQ